MSKKLPKKMLSVCHLEHIKVISEDEKQKLLELGSIVKIDDYAKDITFNRSN